MGRNQTSAINVDFFEEAWEQRVENNFVESQIRKKSE